MPGHQRLDRLLRAQDRPNICGNGRDPLRRGLAVGIAHLKDINHHPVRMGGDPCCENL